MELGLLDRAEHALDAALALDATWEATHYERAKLALRADETEAAVSAFAEAGRLMPTFSAALSNLGAALGELDRHDEALAALRQALLHDPDGFPILNNIGVVCRDTGRMADAERAFRKVTHVASDFVFGHYNLGHVLFLQGRFAEARVAYDDGLRRDLQKNARQACRAAVVRAGAGDADAAIVLLRAVTDGLPHDVVTPLLQEAVATLEALLTLESVPRAAIATVLGWCRR